MIDADLQHHAARAGSHDELHKHRHKHHVAVPTPKSTSHAASHPKKARSKKAKMARHNRRRQALTALTQVDQAPENKDILDPKNVKVAGIDKDGYKEDWVKEWRHNPHPKTKAPTTPPPKHSGVEPAQPTAFLAVLVIGVTFSALHI